MPDGIDLMNYGPDSNPEVISSFNEGYIWDELKNNNQDLSNGIEKSTQCYIFKGESQDLNNLEYFRNTIGIINYLLDNGGIAIYDPFQMKYWSKKEWSESTSNNKIANPLNQVVILNSKNEDGTSWLHTRGLIKYGRPDLSFDNVIEEIKTSALEMFNRFIEFQAFGGILEDGKSINMKGLPNNLTCKTLGTFDDTDFNNLHVEIK
jgi:hypothetical protein